MSNNVAADILIVGAGLAGLMLATTLVGDGEAEQRRILLVDKGPSVGGRLATRRIGPGRADHGAQFMTVRAPEFQAHVDQWLADGVVYKWSNGWGPNFDGYPRYAVHDGFNALAKYLASKVVAKGVEIQTSVRLAQLSTSSADDSAAWRAVDENGNVYQADTAVMTSPVPQSLALLDAGGVSLSAQDRAALEKLVYAPCLCGLFWVEGATTFEEPGMALNPNERISWMADNQRKGISPDARLVTVHGNPTFSSANYDAADEVVLSELRASLEPFLSPGTKFVEEQLKRWRYAQPLQLYPDRFLKATSLPPLYFGGDIFGDPRVEGASLSGIAIGQSIGGAV